ncbi:uncharacterized protein LOC121651089 isoform X1 [Melanotaenia boesemani]|uniref:uncharacterized protein LOC121651089 isoform X1 n=1 Tax=Melanotaenia boesemani TaxID=1250792 RepID=UPI001C057547|nr:uncharacterized protein LOC121651089 isoform X1 [Melanotaenia boesemani]XP_041858904.1 uncharacterized protein LOC121651089 isoform X1 [Melanotaenia boesemani]
MKDFLTSFPSGQFTLFFTITACFAYHAMVDETLSGSSVHDCNVHMVVPAVVLFFLKLWADQSFQRAFIFVFKGLCTRFLYLKMLSRVFLFGFSKALLVALLWVIAMLVDGDWYVCCNENHCEHEMQQICKNQSNITSEEKLYITEMKTRSKVSLTSFFPDETVVRMSQCDSIRSISDFQTIGFGLLLAVVTLASLISPLERMQRCHIQYFNLFFEEEEQVMEQIWREKIKDGFSEIMKNKTEAGLWRECENVAQKLIEAEPTSRKPQASSTLKEFLGQEDENEKDTELPLHHISPIPEEVSHPQPDVGGAESTSSSTLSTTIKHPEPVRTWTISDDSAEWSITISDAEKRSCSIQSQSKLLT